MSLQKELPPLFGVHIWDLRLLFSQTPNGPPLPGPPLLFGTHLYKEYIQNSRGVPRSRAPLGVHNNLTTLGLAGRLSGPGVPKEVEHEGIITLKFIVDDSIISGNNYSNSSGSNSSSTNNNSSNSRIQITER